MKLIILNGSSCSGKSTVVKNIMLEKEGYFHISYDGIKWQFSRYTSGKYTKEIYTIMSSLLNTVCTLKSNVICEAYHPEPRKELIEIAKNHGYEIVEINLEADWEVLSKRFEEKLARKTADPKINMANTSKDRFKELFDMYEKGKNPSAITFRTDTQSVEEISSSILKLL